MAETTRASDAVKDDQDSSYWGEFSLGVSERLATEADTDGYQSAVRRCLPRALQPYVLDESRALWWPLVRADLSETTAVDLGAGWGAISAGLARTGA
ncbi:MAG: hypothetical protein ACRDIA_03915, partial [Actinomycetota bacterium]